MELKCVIGDFGESDAFQEIFQRCSIDIADLLEEGSSSDNVSPFLLTWHPNNLVQWHDCVLYRSFFLLLCRVAGDESVHDAFDLLASLK